jgi:hypothetical protein
MTTKDNMQDSLFIFIKDKSFPVKEKVKELDEMISLCNAGIKILSGDGITSASHLMACLDEQIEDKANNVESVAYLDDVQGTNDTAIWGCTKCGNQWVSKTVIPCNVCYPDAKE